MPSQELLSIIGTLTDELSDENKKIVIDNLASGRLLLREQFCHHRLTFGLCVEQSWSSNRLKIMYHRSSGFGNLAGKETQRTAAAETANVRDYTRTNTPSSYWGRRTCESLLTLAYHGGYFITSIESFRSKEATRAAGLNMAENPKSNA
jgi:hypothetical protein